MSILVEKTLETNLNLCELGNINYKKDYSTYESYKSTSYLVEKTNNHTISSDNSGYWAKVTLTVKDNSNCCPKITDTEKEETVTRCTKSQLNPEDALIQLIKHRILLYRIGVRHFDLHVMNGIGKLFSIIGSNVKLNVQLVEYDETPTKVGNVRNFQDNAGTDKIQVILPINNNMRACWIFNDKFNMTERDPIICQYI